MTTAFWFNDEENGCMNCGDLDYSTSITAGLCIHCNPVDSRFDNDEEYFDFNELL